MNLQLKQLRAKMEENNISMYIVMSDDFHQSEYVGEYFKARAYVSKFTGSAGYILVSKDKAILWTDGRYFIQAATELKDSGFELYKMGVEGFDTLEEVIKKHLKHGDTLGFDGRTMPATLGDKLGIMAQKLGADCVVHLDLVGEIWTNRPKLPQGKVFELGLDLAGISRVEKLNEIRKHVKIMGANYHIITSLDDIMWTLNIRGRDIAHSPVALSYLFIDENHATLFIDREKLSPEIVNSLASDGVILKDYFEFYDFVKHYEFEAPVMIDKNKINFLIYNLLRENSSLLEQHSVEVPCIVNTTNPSMLMKAIKNPVEIENMKKIHIIDSVAVTKYMMYMKQYAGVVEMDEYEASVILENFRKQNNLYYEDSFSPISAYGPNAAIMHYSAKKGDCAKIERKGLYLIDSGGQYMGGTTDITRTFALGETTHEEKVHFTMVLKSVINLSKIKFLYGCNGQSLDILSRSVMWNEGIDYKSGTGHGVGYMLNVHEAPNGFRWKSVPERNDSGQFEVGMHTTIEPGVYIEGKYGIRTEQEVLTKVAFENEYGKFMEFENMTFVPIDLDAVIVEMLKPEEIAFLNAYHAQVYEKLAPYFSEEDIKLLAHYTRAV